jgi:hypothetical protein
MLLALNLCPNVRRISHEVSYRREALGGAVHCPSDLYIGVRHQRVSGAIFLVDEINPGCYRNYNMYFIQTGLHAQGN